MPGCSSAKHFKEWFSAFACLCSYLLRKYDEALLQEQALSPNVQWWSDLLAWREIKRTFTKKKPQNNKNLPALDLCPYFRLRFIV